MKVSNEINTIDILQTYETFNEREKNELYLLVGYLTNVLDHQKAGRKADTKFYNEKFLNLENSFLPTLTLEKRKAAKAILAEVQVQNGC